VSSITSVDDSNPQVVVFHMSIPDAYLSTTLAAQNFGILKKNFGGMTAKAYYAHPISAGPFAIQSQNSTGTSLTLVRNPYYWDQPRPYLDGMTWTYVSDPSQQLLELKSGAADLVFPPLPFDEVRTLPATEVAYVPNSVINETLFVNVRKAPMNDLRFREAVTLGINRALISQGLWDGKATPSKSAIGDNLPDSVTPTGGDWTTFNLHAAQADLAQSSYKRGTPVSIMVSSDQSNDVTLAEALTQELQAVGITAVVQKFDFNTWFSRTSGGNFQISLHYSGNDFPSEGSNLEYVSTPGIGFDYTGAPYTVATNQWPKYQVATSIAGRIAALQPVEDYMYANKMVIPVVDIPAPYAVSPKAHIPFAGYLLFNPAEAWLSS
jgi:peptide/nickel transport system substrate-binding protein